MREHVRCAQCKLRDRSPSLVERTEGLSREGTDRGNLLDIRQFNTLEETTSLWRSFIEHSDSSSLAVTPRVKVSGGENLSSLMILAISAGCWL